MSNDEAKKKRDDVFGGHLLRVTEGDPIVAVDVIVKFCELYGKAAGLGPCEMGRAAIVAGFGMLSMAHEMTEVMDHVQALIDTLKSTAADVNAASFCSHKKDAPS